MAGGNGALAMRDQFSNFHIEVLEDFSALDGQLDQLTKRFTIPG
jgi:hypothetical protein